MTRLCWVVGCILVTATAACSSTPAPMPTDDAPPHLDTDLALQPTPSGQPVQLIWEGRSGDHHVRWTTAEIAARPMAQLGRVAFSAAALAARQVAEQAGADEAGADRCSYERGFALLSVVGPLLSLYESREDSCRSWAHPAQETRYTTVGLETARVLSLPDVFPADAVYRALREEAAVQGKLVRTSAAPETLAGLIADLADGEPLIAADGGPCAYFAPEDLLSRFAFHRVEGRARRRAPAPAIGPRNVPGPVHGSWRSGCRYRPLWRMPSRQPLSAASGFLLRDEERIGSAAQMSLRFDRPQGVYGVVHAEAAADPPFAVHVLGRVLGRQEDYWVLQECGDDFELRAGAWGGVPGRGGSSNGCRSVAGASRLGRWGARGEGRWPGGDPRDHGERGRTPRLGIRDAGRACCWRPLERRRAAEYRSGGEGGGV